jgi:hypothetical protein
MMVEGGFDSGDAASSTNAVTLTTQLLFSRRSQFVHLIQSSASNQQWQDDMASPLFRLLPSLLLRSLVCPPIQPLLREQFFHDKTMPNLLAG